MDKKMVHGFINGEELEGVCVVAGNCVFLTFDNIDKFEYDDVITLVIKS